MTASRIDHRRMRFILILFFLVGIQSYGYTTAFLDTIPDLRDSILLESVEILAPSGMADPWNPVTKTVLSKEQIRNQSNGKDLPYLLTQVPSAQWYSDAGNGIGYTYLKIRGTEPARLQVSLNGVPFNDAESQSVYWVDIPDIAASASEIQIQRGSGLAQAGVHAYGGGIQINTITPIDTSYQEFQGTLASYDTWKVAYHWQQKINAQWQGDLRMSAITSEGYMDRAFSRLGSVQGQIHYTGKRWRHYFIMQFGREKTYQAWAGVPIARVNNDEVGIQAFIERNGLDSLRSYHLWHAGRTYNPYQYENEIDLYKQQHYQWISLFSIKNDWQGKLLVHQDAGKGYYEQFVPNASLSQHQVTLVEGGDTLGFADLVRQRWLDNDQWGLQCDLQKQSRHWLIRSGGGILRYDGAHFGKVLQAGTPLQDVGGVTYYRSKSVKYDGSIYVRIAYHFNHGTVFGEIQGRTISYTSTGTNSEQQLVQWKERSIFFNPALGFQRKLSSQSHVRGFLSWQGKEPTRADYVSYLNQKSKVQPEYLFDAELAYAYTHQRFQWELNAFRMYYRNQLIPTGRLDDVGNPIRENVSESLRAGMELSGQFQINQRLQLLGHSTWMRSWIPKYDYTVYEYTGGATIAHVSPLRNVAIALSPNYTGSLALAMHWSSEFSSELQYLSTGSQKLDQSGSPDAILPSYSTWNVKVRWEHPRWSLTAECVNVFNRYYSGSGYSYEYIAGNIVRETFLFPQAPRHFSISWSYRFKPLSVFSTVKSRRDSVSLDADL